MRAQLFAARLRKDTGPVPKITYVDSDGSERAVDATVGDSVMATAIKNGVSGIVAECGGNCSCGTCHVYVQEEFSALVGPPSECEEDLFEMAVSEPRSNSRLSCQIKVTEELDGLVVQTPAEQP